MSLTPAGNKGDQAEVNKEDNDTYVNESLLSM